MSEMDLNGIAEQLNNAVETPSVPSSSPSPTSTPDTGAASPVTDSTPTDDVIEVTFNDGVKEAIKRSELPNYVLRQKDYTKKTQEVAALKQRYQTLEQNLPQIQQEIAFAEQMRQATQDPQALLGYLVQQLGPQQAMQHFAALMQQNPAAYDPNDIPTYQEADKLITDKLSATERKLVEMEQRFDQMLNQRLEQAQQASNFKRQEQEYASQFDTLINKTFEDHPELKAVDMVEDIMRFKVAQKIENFYRINGHEPAFAQAAQWFGDAVKEQVNKLNTHFAVNKQASALNNSIEPSGGQRPVGLNTQPKSYYNPKTGDMDSDSLLRDLEERIKGLSRL